MRIACPACNAEYDVPEDRLPAGKVVRCARCGENWTPVAKPVVLAAQEEVYTPPPPNPPQVAVVPEERYVEPSAARGSLPVVIAWVVSLAVLAAAAWGAYARRDDIVQIWPASERAYLALGIPVRS